MNDREAMTLHVLLGYYNFSSVGTIVVSLDVMVRYKCKLVAHILQ